MTAYAARRESLTLAQLRGILAELEAAGAAPTAADVMAVLRRHDRPDLPLDVVAALVDAGPASSLPLKRLEELMDRIG